MDAYRLLQLVYWACLAWTCTIAWARGGAPERWGSGALAAGSVLAVWAANSSVGGYASAQLGILAVDIAFLAALTILLIRSDRFWPIWASGFQLVGVATHLAKLTYPYIVPEAYWAVQGMWAYPIMLAIVAGTTRARTPRGSAPA